MLSLLRRAFRRVVPRPVDPWLDAPVIPAPLDTAYGNAYESAMHESERGDPFAAGRFEDAKRWRGILDRVAPSDRLVLDLASGSGGVSLSLAAGGRRVVSVDFGWSETARLAHARAGAAHRHVIADSAALPFRDESFGAVICLDSFEHFRAPAASAAEASRVARRGAPIAVETPGRLPYLFRRDPHYGIRFLLLLPAALQRKIAVRRGFDQPHHYTHRIYTSARSIARLFPHCRIERILGRSRFPRRWFFSAVILRKL